jgi:hypothetical protein
MFNVCELLYFLDHSSRLLFDFFCEGERRPKGENKPTPLRKTAVHNGQLSKGITGVIAGVFLLQSVERSQLTGLLSSRWARSCTFYTSRGMFTG